MPIQTIVMMVFVFVFIGISMLWNKKRMAQAMKDTADSRAGKLAEKMGLRVVEGDPETNLAMVAHTDRNKSDGEETTVVLEGSPNGRATRVYYFHKRTSKVGFTETTTTTWIGAEVSVAVHSPFPEFEVLQKNPGHYGSELKPKLGAAPIPTGDVTVDGKLHVKAHDARVAQALAASLIAPAAWGFVHIHGKDGKLTFHATKSTITYLGIADQIQQVLVHMATQLEAAAASHGA